MRRRCHPPASRCPGIPKSPTPIALQVHACHTCSIFPPNGQWSSTEHQMKPLLECIKTRNRNDMGKSSLSAKSEFEFLPDLGNFSALTAYQHEKLPQTGSNSGSDLSEPKLFPPRGRNSRSRLSGAKNLPAPHARRLGGALAGEGPASAGTGAYWPASTAMASPVGLYVQERSLPGFMGSQEENRDVENCRRIVGKVEGVVPYSSSGV